MPTRLAKTVEIGIVVSVGAEYGHCWGKYLVIGYPFNHQVLDVMGLALAVIYRSELLARQSNKLVIVV